MKKIIAIALVLVPSLVLAGGGLIDKPETKGCGGQKVVLSGEAFGWEDVVMGTAGIQVILDKEELSGVMTGESLKAMRWTKEVNVRAGKHTVEVTLYEDKDRTQVAETETLEFSVPACVNVASDSGERGSVSGGYSWKKRCALGIWGVEKCRIFQINDIVRRLEWIKKQLEKAA